MDRLKHNISFPSKTFLIGEYAVLEGAPAILVNTKPHFKFFVTERKKLFKGAKQIDKKELFHPQSPAGQWLKKQAHLELCYDIEYQDPYLGKGGFGSSSAQFNFVYWLCDFLNRKSANLSREGVKKELALREFTREEEVFKLWNAYRSLDFKGQKPSGADVVSQWLGGVCVFCTSPFSARSIKWPFLDLDFFLIRTGTTFNTYEHLQNLSMGKKFSNLCDIAQQARDSINKVDRPGFISALKEYSHRLKERGLIDKKTLGHLSFIKSLKEVIIAKGCGAMGAEVIAVFFNPKDRTSLRHSLKKENIIVSSKDLT